MEIHSVNSIWEIIGDTPAEISELEQRGKLFREITDIIIANRWTKKQIAKMCGVDIKRSKNLKERLFELFTLQELQTISENLKINLAEQNSPKPILGISPTLQPA